MVKISIYAILRVAGRRFKPLVTLAGADTKHAPLLTIDVIALLVAAGATFAVPQ
jgi:predicted Kef-type K+ transport protein